MFSHKERFTKEDILRQNGDDYIFKEKYVRYE